MKLLLLFNYIVLQWVGIRLGRIYDAGQDPFGPTGKWTLTVGVLPLTRWPASV